MNIRITIKNIILIIKKLLTALVVLVTAIFTAILKKEIQEKCRFKDFRKI